MLNKTILSRSIVGMLAAILATGTALASETGYKIKIPNASDNFSPPSVEDIPDNKFGESVRYGMSLFNNTQQLRGKYVGNGMNCVNCHLDNGRKPDAAPLWGAFPNYPAYRGKNKHVNTMEERIQGCFTYSMNGTPPPYGSKELTALVSYHYWLSKGVPVGTSLPGRGYPKLEKTGKEPSVKRGKQVFANNCAICHGADGHGTQVDGKYVFPPLWGKDSYNWGAGMHRINTAASFIKANMPLGKPNSLSDQQAWDVAAFINSHERPQDPRYEDSIGKTADDYHQHQCLYDKKVNGKVLGKGTQ